MTQWAPGSHDRRSPGRTVGAVPDAPLSRPSPVHHWTASLATLAALVLYLLLPRVIAVGPRWLIPALEAALIVILHLVRALRHSGEEVEVRVLIVAVIALISVANVISVCLLVDHLLYGGIDKGRPLFYAAVSVWCTNIVVYSLWFWQLDRGGPVARAHGRERAPDFQFPQMLAAPAPVPAPVPAPMPAPMPASGEPVPTLPAPTQGSPWAPTYFDYFYVALTNAAAFSPTDTMPLSRAAKALMSAESLVSIVTVGIVAARAVNILG